MSAAIVMRPQFLEFETVLETVQATAAAVTERKGPVAVRVAPRVTVRGALHLVQACEGEVQELEPLLLPLPSLATATGASTAAANAAADRAGYPFYRKYTEGMLRRYGKLSMESGRIPSMLGREMFRGKVTSYKVHGFDDVVIFVRDVERCLKGMTLVQQHLVERIALQGYTQEETAALLGVSLRTVIRQYNATLDALTRVFLTRKMLQPMFACTQD